MTAYCLNLLGRQLGPLKQAEAAGRLVPQVGAPACPGPVLDQNRALAAVVLMLPAPDITAAYGGTIFGISAHDASVWRLASLHVVFEPNACTATDAHAAASVRYSCHLPHPVPLAAHHGTCALLQELALLAALEQACEALLARCFENYAQLAEAAPSGVLEGGQAAPELPAPALLPAVELCNILRDALKPVDQARPAVCVTAVIRDQS